MIRRDDVFKEVLSIEDFSKLLKSQGDLPKAMLEIYKLNFMLLRLELDTRYNLVQLSKGRKIEFKERPKEKTEKEPDNAVIKKTDDIKVDK